MTRPLTRLTKAEMEQAIKWLPKIRKILCKIRDWNDDPSDAPEVYWDVLSDPYVDWYLSIDAALGSAEDRLQEEVKRFDASGIVRTDLFTMPETVGETLDRLKKEYGTKNPREIVRLMKSEK